VLDDFELAQDIVYDAYTVQTLCGSESRCIIPSSSTLQMNGDLHVAALVVQVLKHLLVFVFSSDLLIC
jgi:hypothetical protein